MMKGDNFVFGDTAPLTPAGEGVTRKVLAYNDDLMLCELHFETGAVGSLHRHPHQQISYIISGSFEFEINGVKRVVKAGDSLYKEPNVEHGAVCLEAGVLLDFFTPMRDDFVQ
ncbi:MAG TPA: cupin domain-containing protein [Sphaerochaeta sp.]|nr:cupin domain-containing protein [Sphaerochaeta sp.]HPK47434.1 cupin domain-containing protein [Sphaerochaeta sp.]